MSSVAVCRSAHRPMDAWCRQAFSLISKGRIVEARKLAHALAFDFPWLWSKEGDFQEHKVCQEIASLRKFLLEGAPLSLEQQSSDFFFQEDAEFDPAWKRVDVGSIHSILTFEGEETGLGAFYSDGIEIRSFGPQALPLSRSSGFGIRPVHRENRQWVSCFALPEVWMQIDAKPIDVYRNNLKNRNFGKEALQNFDPERVTIAERQGASEDQNSGEKPTPPKTDSLSCFGINGGELLLEFSFLGLNAKSPLALAFYAKAKAAKAGTHVVAPRSLQRYGGESVPVVFEECLELKASWEGKVYLLPLAGFGGFWGCEYLAAFEIPPCCSKGSITVRCLI